MLTGHLFPPATFGVYDGGPHDCVLVDPGIYTPGTCHETHVSPTNYDGNNLQRYILQPVPGNTVAVTGTGVAKGGNSHRNVSGNFHRELGRGTLENGWRSVVGMHVGEWRTGTAA